MDKIRSYLNYYAGIIRRWELKKKIIITDAYFHSFSPNEILCLRKAQKIFGDQADFVDGHKQKDSFLVLLKNVEFLGNTGAVAKDSKLVIESQLDLTRTATSRSFRKVQFLKTKKRTGIYTSIIHLNYSDNFYHWNIDCLPRLYNIKQIPVDTEINLILNVDQPSYQKEILGLFMKKDPRLQPVYIKKSEKWLIDCFWLPSFVTAGQSGYMPKENIQYVKNTVLEGFDLEDKEKGRRIYISRSRAPKRKLLNELQVEDFLRTKQFEIIHMEDFSFREQVQIINEANVVITPHGAGLSNILYGTDLTIVEIHPINYVQTHYCTLSSACGHIYKCFFANEMNEQGDFNLSLDRFQKFIEQDLLM